MQINYHKKSVYGVDKIYINDEKTAASVSKLTGKKTIDARDIEALSELGHLLIHQPIN
jgi:type IV secretory pathway TraG/TraD family ATPase VirD4